jgi:RNA polymerase-binding transcription factor DksA
MESDKLRNLLLSKKNELLVRREKIHQDFSTRHISRGFSQQAKERDNDDVLAALDKEAQEELQKIKSALQRLDNSSFQDCKECGKTISDKRLLAIPYTCYCRDCAKHHVD